jgi:NTE family protein
MGKSILIPVYAGMSVEFGNVFQFRSDIHLDDIIPAGSIYMGLDTFIGPIYLAYGFAEAGRRNFYLFLGQPPRYRQVGFMN